MVLRASEARVDFFRTCMGLISVRIKEQRIETNM